MSFSGEREITSLCNATLLNCIAGHGFPTMHYTAVWHAVCGLYRLNSSNMPKGTGGTTDAELPWVGSNMPPSPILEAAKLRMTASRSACRRSKTACWIEFDCHGFGNHDSCSTLRSKGWRVAVVVGALGGPAGGIGCGEGVRTSRSSRSSADASLAESSSATSQGRPPPVLSVSSPKISAAEGHFGEAGRDSCAC